MKNKNIIRLALLAVLSAVTLVQAADSLVEFHIRKGTGEGAWNTPQTLLDLKVGQTLRIINDDTVPHRLHTFGRPCPHQPEDSQPGEFYDCGLADSVDPRVEVLYDHNFGERARFYLRVTR